MSGFYGYFPTPTSGPLQPVTEEVPRYQSCNPSPDPTFSASFGPTLQLIVNGIIVVCFVWVFCCRFSEWRKNQAVMLSRPTTDREPEIGPATPPSTRPTPSRTPTPSFLEDGCSPAPVTSTGSASSPKPSSPAPETAFHPHRAARQASISGFGLTPSFSSIELGSINGSSRLAPVPTPGCSRPTTKSSVGKVFGGAPSMEELPQTPPPQPGMPVIQHLPAFDPRTPTDKRPRHMRRAHKSPSKTPAKTPVETLAKTPAMISHAFVPPVPQSLVSNAEQVALDALLGLEGITEVNETLPMVPALVLAPRFVFVAREVVTYLTKAAKEIDSGTIDLGAMMSVADLIEALGEAYMVALGTFHTVGPYSCDRWPQAIGDFAFASRQSVEHLDVISNANDGKLWFRSREYAKTVLDIVSHAVHDYIVENELPTLPNRLVAKGNSNAAYVARLLSRQLPTEAPSPSRCRPKTESEASYNADVSGYDTTGTDSTLSGGSSNVGSWVPSGSYTSISAGSIRSAREVGVAMRVVRHAQAPALASTRASDSQQAAPSATSAFLGSSASISAGSIHSARGCVVAQAACPALPIAVAEARSHRSEASTPSASASTLTFSLISAADIKCMVQCHMGRTSFAPSQAEHSQQRSSSVSAPVSAPASVSMSASAVSSSSATPDSLARARQALRTAPPPRPSCPAGFREEPSAPPTSAPPPSSSTSSATDSLARARQALRTAPPPRPSCPAGFREEPSAPPTSAPPPSSSTSAAADSLPRARKLWRTGRFAPRPSRPAAPQEAPSSSSASSSQAKESEGMIAYRPEEITPAVLELRRQRAKLIAAAAAAAPWLPGYGPDAEQSTESTTSTSPDRVKQWVRGTRERMADPPPSQRTLESVLEEDASTFDWLPSPGRYVRTVRISAKTGRVVSSSYSGDLLKQWVRGTRERMADPPPSQRTLESVLEGDASSFDRTPSPGGSIRSIAAKTPASAGPSNRPPSIATDNAFRWTFLPEDKEESSLDGDSIRSWRSNVLAASVGGGTELLGSPRRPMGSQTFERMLARALGDWKPSQEEVKSERLSAESFSEVPLERPLRPRRS